MSSFDSEFVSDPAILGDFPLGNFSLRETTVLPFAPLPEHHRTSDIAVVTWVAGDKGYEWFSITGPAMKRYADWVGADLIVIEGFGGQPYLMANKFRVKQTLTQYGYDAVLYVDADALIQDHCVDIFRLIPSGHIGILNEAPLYDEWTLAKYRREALALAWSQGMPLRHENVPPPRNAGVYYLPKCYTHVLDHPTQPFPICGRNGLTLEQTWMSLKVAESGAPIFDFDLRLHWLWYADHSEQNAADAMILHFAGLGSSPRKRYQRLAHYAAQPKPAAGDSTCIIDGRERVPGGHFDCQLMLHASAQPALRMPMLRNLRTRDHGWSVATKLLSVLSNPDGVIFDDFVESTFLWHGHESLSAGIIPYTEPWMGFIHNPPHSPDWPSIRAAGIANLSSSTTWMGSLQHCLGLYAMTDYLAEWATKQWGIPCEVVRYPAIIPEKKFSIEDFTRQPEKTVASIGFWLRRYSSFDQLRADGYRKLRPLPVTREHGAELARIAQYEREERAHAEYADSAAQTVTACDRLSNDEYDDLLSRSIVFLDLIDASAVITIVECLVRGTPLLVNRIAPVEEYLGSDYPLYFDTLDEAGEKIANLDLIQAAHSHMRENPILHELRPQTFLDRLVATATYQRALGLCG